MIRDLAELPATERVDHVIVDTMIGLGRLSEAGLCGKSGERWRRVAVLELRRREALDA